MRIRYMATIGVTIAASLLVLSASAACGKEDHERIAEDVTREWAMTEAEDISEEKGDHERIAEDVAREWTVTEADGISEEIAEMATRRYGSPRLYPSLCQGCLTTHQLILLMSCPLQAREPYEEKNIRQSADAGQIQRDDAGGSFRTANQEVGGRALRSHCDGVDILRHRAVQVE